MSFTLRKFVVTFVITIFLGLIVVAGLRSFGLFGKGSTAASDPAKLILQANEALEAVRNRKPGDRRPASYDSIMAPLDNLLKQARDLLESETFNPVGDYDKVRALTLPVIDIATKADTQARNERGFITKEYRFNSQKAEACHYLANTLWERVNRMLPDSGGFFNESVQYPQSEMRELKRILDMGLEADPENADLYYTRGIVNRAEGLFVPAARDLEQAVSISPNMSGAWSTLGLVRINLKDFDKAEDALDRARATILKQQQDFNLNDPGEEYTSIIYNLATFHEGLASFYNRENRITPTVEYQALAQKHSAEARQFFQEFLTREPADSPDARNAKAKLQALP